LLEWSTGAKSVSVVAFLAYCGELVIVMYYFSLCRARYL